MIDEIKEHISELWDTLSEKPLDILFTSFLLWIALPVIIFGIWGIVQVAFFNKLDTNIFTNLFVNSMVPWWASILENFGRFLIEYLFAFIIVLGLVHLNILEPTKPNIKVIISYFSK